MSWLLSLDENLFRHRYKAGADFDHIRAFPSQSVAFGAILDRGYCLILLKAEDVCTWKDGHCIDILKSGPCKMSSAEPIVHLLMTFKKNRGINRYAIENTQVDLQPNDDSIFQRHCNAWRWLLINVWSCLIICLLLFRDLHVFPIGHMLDWKTVAMVYVYLSHLLSISVTPVWIPLTVVAILCDEIVCDEWIYGLFLSKSASYSQGKYIPKITYYVPKIMITFCNLLLYILVE